MGSKKFTVFTQAAQKPDTNHYGVGWIVTNGNDKERTQGAKRVSKKEINMTLAQVHAVSHALSLLKKNSIVLVHSGSELVCDAIASKALAKKAKNADSPAIRKAWSELEKQVNRHKSVDAKYKDDLDPRMAQAYRKAQEGSEMAYSDNRGKRDRRTPRTGRERVTARELEELGL